MIGQIILFWTFKDSMTTPRCIKSWNTSFGCNIFNVMIETSFKAELTMQKNEDCSRVTIGVSAAFLVRVSINSWWSRVPTIQIQLVPEYHLMPPTSATTAIAPTPATMAPPTKLSLRGECHWTGLQRGGPSIRRQSTKMPIQKPKKTYLVP